MSVHRHGSIIEVAQPVPQQDRSGLGGKPVMYMQTRGVHQQHDRIGRVISDTLLEFKVWS